MRVFSILLCLSLAPAAGAAVPTELAHQGRLFDSLGVPLDGPHDVTLRLYDDATAGVMVYESAQSGVGFDNGYYSVALDGVDDTMADGSKLWLALDIDGTGELATRVPVVSVPYALRSSAADVATDVSGGVVDATEIRVNGTTVIDATGTIVSGGGNDDDTLRDLTTCVLGQLVTYDGLDWVCGDANAHNHDASQITGGVLDIARLPVGSGSANVAVGDHLHALTTLTGIADIAQLPTGTGSAEVATGDHTHGAGSLPSIDQLSGVATLAQLPVGSSGSDVAVGNHTHTTAFTDLIGSAGIGQLPVGATASDVAAGNHTHTQADITGAIDADTVAGIAPADLVTKTSSSGVVPAGGTFDVVHGQGSFDVGVTVWEDVAGTWQLSSLGGAVSSMPVTGLQAFYDFDEGSGTTATDSSGNGNTATLQAGAGWGAGQSGTAADFSGNSGYFEAADSASLDVSTAAITMAAWVRRDTAATTDHYIIFNKESSYEWALFPGTADLRWAIQTSTTGWFWHPVGYTMPLNQWVHLAVVYDGSNVRTYVDGGLTDTLAYTGTVTPSNATLRVGARGGASGRFRIGQVDSAAIYNRALSVPELSQLAATSAPAGLTVSLSDNNTVTIANPGSSDADVNVVVHH